MPPLFSIIIPCYNAGEKLQASVESVLSQAPGLFECRVVDGGSTDESTGFLEQVGHNALHWKSERDAGVYDAMNKGIALSQGRFLYFLGAGDLLAPGLLQELAEFIATLPETKPRFIYGNVRFMRDGGRVGDGFFDKKKMSDLNVPHQALFYERSIYELLGPYDLSYRIFSDWVYNLRCFGDDRIARYYWAGVIADYEGGGLSDRAVDERFNRDRSGLIRRWLGLAVAAGYLYRLHLRPFLKSILGRSG